MDVAVFQQKLAELCSLAEQHEKKLTTEQVRECFEQSDLETEQLLRVLQYLKSKGIEIEGVPAAAAAEETSSEPQTVAISVPLTPEEEAYLKDYLEGFESQEEIPEAELTECFSRWQAGDAGAQARLTQYYLPMAARMAADRNCEEIALPDLIQEANVGLLMALDSEGEADTEKNDAWIRRQIQNSISEAIEEQTEQRIHDDALVSRVEGLEAAVKELTDEDDGELKFTVDELAVILDMKVDEIRDILRLTGDDK